MRKIWPSCSVALSACAISLALTPLSAFAADLADGARDDIIVTATRRSQVMTDVPLAISAISAKNLDNAGAHDIRQLNQLSPSLFVSSSSSEAVGGVARIRGIGTVGDNPGLESSVATFVDGVYRSRSGVAFTELGAVDRIEVARGPQGTLFGRNALAGLINVITTAPSFEEGGTAELSYGNYDHRRAKLGLTGPINAKIAYRLDGVYTKRDGFMVESNDYPGASSRRFNNRNRWLMRGQLLLKPSDTTTVRLIADYAKRDEDCCAAAYQQSRNVIRNGDGSISFGPNSMAALMESFGAKLNQDYTQRQVSITPGRSFQSDVIDRGVSAEINSELGDVRLTSITAFRNWESDRGQDADFNNLDTFYRDQLDQSFDTFTQEIRLNGKAFHDTLDWLIGGYYGHETLKLADNLRFGTQYGLVQGCRVANILLPTLPDGSAIDPNALGCLNITGQNGLSAPVLAGLQALSGINDKGAVRDQYRQRDVTWALFTHNVITITPKLSVALGARFTHDRKTLAANILSDSAACADMAALKGTSIYSLTCANNVLGGNSLTATGVDGSYRDGTSSNDWTGSASISYKPNDRLLTYVSWSRGFKSGGFNLDRAGLNMGAPLATQLRFAAETVDAWELGAKYRGRDFRVAATAFYQMFDNFQLNTFNGVSFVVENIQGCSALAGGDTADSDLSGANGTCIGRNKSGVTTKGVEVEASIYPLAGVMIEAGYTLAKTGYRDNITGGAGRGLATTLFQLPGAALSNAPRHVVTGALTWSPAVGGSGLRALVHLDGRFQSRINVGSDLLPEKTQAGVATINARLGLSGADDGWNVALWAQNLFDTNYRQTVAGAPIQGSGSLATVTAGGSSPGSGLFLIFPAEPRTWGVTVRTKF